MKWCVPRALDDWRTGGERWVPRTDITYLRLPRGFAYLVAVIDWYSRKVLSWRISNSMEAVFCVDCLEEALRTHGKPEIFNSDQGSQFTSEGFTDVLSVLAERAGFEPALGYYPKHAFQACDLNHSSISPEGCEF
jgi:transposase InsO family protein